MPARDKPKYAVGFGKPPRRTRFKKGSGNPNGRPRGSRTSSTLLEQALSELVVVTENGQRKKITKGEAMLKQLVNKAASGDRTPCRCYSGRFGHLMTTWSPRRLKFFLVRPGLRCSCSNG
jgi:Family of unknown function (DUF5681)